MYVYLGQIVHNRFKLHFTPNTSLVCNIKKQLDLVKFLSKIDLGIIDERPMLIKLYYCALDKTMQDLVPEEDKSKKFRVKLILVSNNIRLWLAIILGSYYH